MRMNVVRQFPIRKPIRNYKIDHVDSLQATVNDIYDIAFDNQGEKLIKTLINLFLSDLLDIALAKLNFTKPVDKIKML